MTPSPPAELPNQSERPQRDGGVQLSRQGVEIAGRSIPLLAGSMHYYGVEPSSWRRALTTLKELGFRLVDTYVPWSVHEVAQGEFDFGSKNPRRDVARFLRIAEELGLYAIVRPGPHINAELTFFGIPERVIWNPACQARSPGDKPVILPMPPLAFPVPSYASRAFFEEAKVWLGRVATELGPLCWPDGPIVLYQVDNEAALYFRDGAYDQDYHPDAIAEYRLFLRSKYHSVEALREALSDPSASFESVDPPRRFSATLARDLARHLDWAEFQEHMVSLALGRFRRELAGSGLERLPATHNLPMAEAVTPLDPDRLSKTVDLLGLDYYYPASEGSLRAIRERTTELVVRSDAGESPAFACELGAGFPPYFPALTETDSQFAVLAALAYGLRGFNTYMAVERDRWIGAPVDVHGGARDAAEFWKRLLAAIQRSRLLTLRRSTPVQIVVPRSLRRLRRILHAFGSLTPAGFEVLGFGAGAACFEDDFGLEAPVLLDTEHFSQALTSALDAARIPYAWAGADSAEFALANAKWTILLCASGVGEVLVQRFLRAREQGSPVSMGPYPPTRDQLFRTLPEIMLDEGTQPVPLVLDKDASRLASAVAEAARTLSLPSLSAQPREIELTLYADAELRPRVLFAINATASPVKARIAASGFSSAVDALDGQIFRANFEELELTVPARTVRMLEVAGGQSSDGTGT